MSKNPSGPPDGAASPSLGDADRCSYIAEMCVELRDMAPRLRYPALNYFLDLARAEAELLAKRYRAEPRGD